MSAPSTKVKLFENMDMERGTICRQGIYMYGDEPGVYFTRVGHEVSDKKAKDVGFEVDGFRKERALALEIKKVTREAEIKLGFRKDEIESEYADPAVGKKLDSELVTERFKSGGHAKETANYAMKHMGRTMWTVLDKRDGNKQRIEPTEREDAIDWMITHAEEDARVEAEERSDA
jgi:hypothetical protein